MKNLAVSYADIPFLQATRMAIFENLSTTTYTQSYPHFLDGKPDMKSIEIDCQGLSGMGRGVYSPCLRLEGFAMAQAVQDWMYKVSSCHSLGQ